MNDITENIYVESLRSFDELVSLIVAMASMRDGLERSGYANATPRSRCHSARYHRLNRIPLSRGDVSRALLLSGVNIRTMSTERRCFVACTCE